MALVAWILAVFGAGLAFALCAGSAMGVVRQIDRATHSITGPCWLDTTMARMLLPFLRRNGPDLSREPCVTFGINWPVLYLAVLHSSRLTPPRRSPQAARQWGCPPTRSGSRSP
jgi:hypothetical protein